MCSFSDRELLEKVFACIDNTTLNGTDNEPTVAQFCSHTASLISPDGARVAAVCVYPNFVAVAKKQLVGTPIKVASVAGGFPHGQVPLSIKLEEVKYAVEQGADEVDVVINRGLLLLGKYAEVGKEIAAMKNQCANRKLKVIIETGEIPTPEMVQTATQLSIDSGADFIKTSTGKIPEGATLESAHIMLTTLARYRSNTGCTIGFKAAGGIRTPAQAIAYARLAISEMGPEYLAPSTFRIGASSLTASLFSQLSQPS